MAVRSGRVFAGTSGWAYPTWKPGFYPKEVPARRFLEHYGERLNSVEVNYTFRKLPEPAQMEGWLQATPKGFRFSFKAPEAITHRKRLRGCGPAVAEFLDAVEPARAAKKLGLLLFQLPPNFKPDLERLDAFLSLEEMRRAGRVSFEFRHEGWFTPECFALLRRHGAALCVASSESVETPEVHTARGFTSFRLRMPGGYSEAEATAHAARFQALAAKGRDVYVYYKHEDEPTGPLAAEAMLRAGAR
ncbi:DUF72 domain-containing protein [Terriglobus sp.]|uniref:DUF72 domain-containing protein n=1 Tax=Terriglobus sp. TaxID=1889013 RepID=UPI003B0081BA